MTTKKIVSANDSACNILVVGGTGVGKSSLVNYLVGKNVARVGVGEPVTSRDDVSSYLCKFAGVRISLFDTWGIEADKTEDWVDRIQNIIGVYGEDGAAWFHTVIYCISAGGDRVQKNDLKMMRFFKREGFSVVVALTKCDQVSEGQCENLKDALPSGFLSVETSSGGRTRAGASKPFGKEELFKEILKLAIRCLPKRAEKKLCAKIEKWRLAMSRQLVKKDVSRLGNGDIERWIKSQAEEFSEQVNQTFRDFISNEVRAIVAWNRELAGEFKCNPQVEAMEDRDLTGWDYLGMVALSIPFAVFCLYNWIVGSEAEERSKLQSKIDGAATQMADYVKKTLAEFAKKLPQV